MQFQEGQLIGQYRIIKVLDRGRLADTYLGQRDPYSAPALIEALRPPLLSEFQESFLAQVRTLMKLQHPHILSIQDVGLEHHYPFIVTSNISSRTLRQMYPRGSQQPLAVILPYLKQIVPALRYAHGEGILHRDLRPENIWLDEHGQIQLRGFTIEAIIQNRDRLNYQRDNRIDEPFAYTAPEQIQGNAKPSSDQYSLAIIIYELLSGELPFTGSLIEIADKQLNMPPPPLRQKVPDISTRTENAVMKALMKNPAQRFLDLQSFITALDMEHSGSSRAVARRRALPPPAAPRLAMPPETPANAPLPPPLSQQRPVASHVNAPPQTPATIPPQNVVQQVQSPPVAAPQTFQDSAPAPRRRDSNTITRRAFAIGLVGVAALGGAGGWYVLMKKLAAAAPANVLQETTPATPTIVNHQSALIFTGHLAAVNAVSWSPDGKFIVSASDDKYVQIFDAHSGKRQRIYTGHTEEVAAVAWSPSGTFIVSGGQDRTVQVWHANNGAKVLTYQGHTDRVNAVSWSFDSLQIASGSEDKTVQTWDAASGGINFNFVGHTAGVLCVGWQPDGSSVASGSWDGTLRDWATVQLGDHFNAGDQIFSYGGHGNNEVYALDWSPDGNFLVSAGADQTVQISNGIDGTGRPPFFTGHQNKLHVNPVRAVSWSPEGDFIASGDGDGNVIVWKVAGRQAIFTYRGHKGAINALSWSPDGKRIASASADNTVHVWQPM
ncbi:MAG TPA: protein kinase [Ktedonobacteraceae bacterium]